MFASGLGKLFAGPRLQEIETYPFETPADYSLVVDIDQPLGNVLKLH